MKLTTTDITAIKTALAAAKNIDLELAVIRDGKIMGINAAKDACIISQLPLSVPDIQLGIGRVSELEKRLSLFGDEVTAEAKLNDRGETTLITLQAGRSKVQFRCTAMSFLDKKYPKENSDEPLAVATLSKAEVSQLTRASRTLGAETVLIKIGRDSTVLLECSDSTNDQFSMSVEKPAEFIDVHESVVFIYRAGVLSAAMEAACKDADEVPVIIGQAGSFTLTVKGHTIILLPKSQGE